MPIIKLPSTLMTVMAITPLVGAGIFGSTLVGLQANGTSASLGWVLAASGTGSMVCATLPILLHRTDSSASPFLGNSGTLRFLSENSDSRL